jgi:uncharacterized protein YndB with AHSA1/START domain
MSSRNPLPANATGAAGSPLDLTLQRVVDVPCAQVWAAWTVPELLMPWFCPLPWKTVECEIDLRPGGGFRTVMQSPQGERFDSTGCYLELVPERRLVFTTALGADYRPTPASAPPPQCTCILTLEPVGEGGQNTRYTATALHADVDSAKQHADMGFHAGWGTALDQLVAMVKARSTKA